MKKQKWKKVQNHLFRMVSVGIIDEPVNQAYDIISTSALLINLACAFMSTYDRLNEIYGHIFVVVECVTVVFFTIDYVLRLLTAPCLYPGRTPKKAVLSYAFSLTGVIDFLSFVPYYLPIFFPAGAVVFRMFRVARILRLFRINEYFDSMNVITEVFVSKRQQLLSSVFIIVLLMLASSLCMYGVEHEVQPEVFENAFSGIWWAASTLLTVGYGDIYPITTFGKFMGIIIAFLGVGVVAVPTGIISAGFVEHYQKMKNFKDDAAGDIQFIHVTCEKNDSWVGKTVKQLALPKNIFVAAIHRGDTTLIPRGDVKLLAGDRVVLGAEAIKDDLPIHLKELVITKDHPWNGMAIKNLDISRQTFIFMIKRRNNSLIPRGDLILMEQDVVFLYSKIVKDL